MSGRGKSRKTLDLIEAARRILEEIQPATVRAVCYRLFTQGVIPSMAVKYTGMVSKHLVWARENGEIPWEHIVDETREAERITSCDSPEDIIKAAVRGYRKDYWQTQPEWVEVWSEKGTVRGTLDPILKKYGLTFRVMHGFGSATALHGIAEETLYSDKELTVLYVGDWDPSGLWMSEMDIPDRLDRYDGAADIVRVALNRADVGRQTKLPHFDLASKAKDPRAKWFRHQSGTRCWELDALSPVVLRNRVEQEIQSLLDLDAWNRAIEVEAAERESMTSILGTWRSISRQVSKYSDGGEP